MIIGREEELEELDLAELRAARKKLDILVSELHRERLLVQAAINKKELEG